MRLQHSQCLRKVLFCSVTDSLARVVCVYVIMLWTPCHADSSPQLGPYCVLCSAARRWMPGVIGSLLAG
jgi:hypothetical protein